MRAELALSAPWTVLFGPSGSGKTTVLRGICGLLRGAKVSFGRLEDAQWRELTGLPPYRRALGYAPQQSAVFPHMTVRENLIFPTQVRPHGMTRINNNPARLAIDEAIEIFRLSPLLERSPRTLSGGEARRVSLARALATPKIRLLVLDEPFAGLDRGLRDEIIPRLKEWLATRSLPVLSVTHDVDEALLLGADVVRIDAGRVVQTGPAYEVLAAERERMIAALG